MTTCLIIGTGQNFLKEVDEAFELVQFDCVIAVKRSIYYYPGKVDYFVTLHPGWAKEYIEERYRLGYPMGFKTYTVRSFHISKEQKVKFNLGPIFTEHEDGWAGASGLYAIRIAAVVLGFNRIVIAGMPMDLSPRYKENEVWAGGESGVHRYRRGWKNTLEHYGDKVRSMSGWTAQLLGRPDKAWLNPGEV